MCCNKAKKTVKTVGKIAAGYAFLMFGINEELSKKRLRICRNCPKFKNPSCTICGCEMEAKTRLPQEQCSDTKNPRWGRAA